MSQWLWVMNLKGCGMKWLYPNLRYYTVSVRIFSVSVDIQTSAPRYKSSFITSASLFGSSLCISSTRFEPWIFLWCQNFFAGLIWYLVILISTNMFCLILIVGPFPATAASKPRASCSCQYICREHASIMAAAGLYGCNTGGWECWFLSTQVYPGSSITSISAPAHDGPEQWTWGSEF